jgi:hypothetical protein
VSLDLTLPDVAAEVNARLAECRQDLRGERHLLE